MDIVDVTNAQFNSTCQLHQVPCDIKFQWTITIGSYQYVVDQSKGILRLANNQCFLAFEDLNGRGRYDVVLGLLFKN
jgi:hypothetical protein